MFKSNKTIEKAAQKLENRMSKIELIFLFLAAIGFVMKSGEINSGNIILTISLSTLALLYYIS